MEELDPSQFEEISAEGLEEIDPAQFEELDPSQVQEFLPHEDGSAPNRAIPESPVGLWDRVKLSVGNDRGRVDYLKKQFEDVTYDPDGGLVVKDKGAWHKVDPSAFSDPWSASEAIADMLELGADSTLSIAGSAAKGAAVGGAAGAAVAGVGAVPGAVAGGIIGAGAGGAAGRVATSSILGRLAGTYNPESAQDELEDIALEGLLSAGGQAVAVGAKPTLQYLHKSFKTIGKSASQGTKDALAATLGRTTSAGEEATRFMFDNTDDVVRTIKKLKPESVGTTGLIQDAAEKQLASSEKWLEAATKALPRKYGELLDELAEAADDVNLEVDVGTTLKESLKAFEDSGFGKLVKKGAAATDDDAKLASLLESLGKTPEQIAKRLKLKPPKLELVPFSEQDIAARVAKGLPVESNNPEIFKEVRKIFDTVNSFSSVPKLKGGRAARALTDLNKKINSSFSDDLDPIVKRAVSTATASVKTQFGSAFEKAGLRDQWAGMNEVYQRYGDAVSAARKLLNADNGAENFFNSLLAQSGKKVAMKNQADLLEELTGPLGQSLRKEIVTLEAAKRFAPVLPKFGLVHAAASVQGAQGVMSGQVNRFMAVPLAGIFSPRATMAATRGYRAMSSGTSKYAMKLVDMFKTLTPKQMKAALQDENFIRTAMQITFGAERKEQEELEMLLQENGI
jgi:hypothetical protein